MIVLFDRNSVRVTALANEVVAISAEHGFPLWLAYGDVLVGWAAAQRGETVAGVARMRAGIVAATATGARNTEPLFLGLLAEGLALDGNAAEALARLDDAAAAAAQTGQVAAAELWWLRGEVLRSLGSANDEAGSMFAQAIDEARRQGSRLYELRAATSLARLWRDQGGSREAYDLLAPIYAWFTEGFGTRDLKEAKVLLDELAGQQ